MKKRLIFIHPFLFALYPVFFLYALNIHEYAESTLVVPLLLVLIFAAVVFAATKLFVKKIEKAAILSSVVILLFLSYSRILTFVTDMLPKATTPDITQAVVIGSMLLLLIGSIYAVFRFSKHLLQTNKLLTYVAAFLVFVSLAQIVYFEIQTKRIFSSRQAKTIEAKKVTVHTNAPDIYYFIFDRYAGPTSLKEEYNFDNSAFFNFLKEKGFYVAENAKANYPKTFLSLGSSLNMEYLDFLTEQTNGGGSPDESLVTPLIRSSKVLQFVKSNGYTIVNIGPKTWTPTSTNPNADVNFVMQSSTYGNADIFTTGFLNTTLAAPLLQWFFRSPLDVSQDPGNNEHRRDAVYELGAVEKAIAIKGPKFVFVHILLPHDPFVFDKNCNPISEEVVNKHDHIFNYLKQLQCANKKITGVIHDILKKSKTPPVIILQSDEGPFPMKNLISKDQSWSSATDTALREKFPILNAYYFPNASPSALYDSISPVNSFRVLFNTYFDANYPLLPDKQYIFQDQRNYYKFTDVTERVK